MTEFSQREKDFEARFVHDEEIRFKVESLAARLFGLWAAGKMGLKGEEAEAYAGALVESSLAIPAYQKQSLQLFLNSQNFVIKQQKCSNNYSDFLSLNDIFSTHVPLYISPAVC